MPRKVAKSKFGEKRVVGGPVSPFLRKRIEVALTRGDPPAWISRKTGLPPWVVQSIASGWATAQRVKAHYQVLVDQITLERGEAAGREMARALADESPHAAMLDLYTDWAQAEVDPVLTRAKDLILEQTLKVAALAKEFLQ